jgi:hypothetical protein
MHASTQQYLELQRVYRAKADAGAGELQLGARCAASFPATVLLNMDHSSHEAGLRLPWPSAADAAAVEAHARVILEAAGRDAASIPTAEVKHFCKHAGHLR